MEMDMDMSVNLSLSSVAVKPQPQDVGNAVPAPSIPPVASTADSSGSSASKHSDSDAQRLKDAVAQIEKFVASTKRNLQFSIDEGSGRVVVKVIATATGEVVRQIPTAEALKIADNLSKAGSLLFDGKA
jgi:flagellar protein FlaG